MDRQKCKLVTEASVNALKGLEEKFGVKITSKGGRYDNGMAQLKFEFAEVKADGSVSTEASEAYRQLAKFYDLPEDGLGKVFQFRRRQYKVVGLKPRSKCSILAERLPDGRMFKFEPKTAFPGYKSKLDRLTDKETKAELDFESRS